MNEEKDPYEEFNEIIKQGLKAGTLVEKTNIIIQITDMCLKYKKKPKEVIKIMKEVIERLNEEGFMV
jgi:phosphoenolpyruvate synthase/pyruvate phosphate dikinase